MLVLQDESMCNERHFASKVLSWRSPRTSQLKPQIEFSRRLRSLWRLTNYQVREEHLRLCGVRFNYISVVSPIRRVYRLIAFGSSLDANRI